MSLLHHASSSDLNARRPSKAGPDGSPSPESASSRRLSFNPVADWVPPVAVEEPLGAFEVPKWKRYTQIGIAIIYCLFAAGIVFGYAAIKPVLVREGVYRNYCTDDELREGVDICYGQEIRLNFMFTVAAVATNVSALPIGTILDRFGPRVCGVLSSVFVAAGCLLFAFAFTTKAFDGYIAGYFFLALGGPFVYISSFQLSNAFPRNSGLILALLTSAFDTSSAIFLFYRLIYTATNGEFWPRKFFLIYLVVPAFILIVQVFIMPAKSYQTVGEILARAEDDSTDVHPSDARHAPAEAERRQAARRERRESVISVITTLLDSKDGERRAKKWEDKEAKSGVYGVLHGQPAGKQILTLWWALIAAFTVIQMCRINYFVATVRTQYITLLNDRDKAIQVNSAFDIALPLGGVLAAPFVGIVLDNLSTAATLSILVTFAFIIGVLGLLPFMWAAYINVILFCVYRPFYYTTISDYCAKVFGFETFGKVYGLIICIAGLFNFIQSALDKLTHETFNNDPRPVNIILMSIGLVTGLCLVAYVTYQARKLAREQLENEAEGATVSLIPGADERTNEDYHPVRVHDYGATNGQQPH